MDSLSCFFVSALIHHQNTLQDIKVSQGSCNFGKKTSPTKPHFPGLSVNTLDLQMDSLCDLCWQYSLHSTAASQTSKEHTALFFWLKAKVASPLPPSTTSDPPLQFFDLNHSQQLAELTLVFLERQHSGSWAPQTLHHKLKHTFSTHTNLQTKPSLCVSVGGGGGGCGVGVGGVEVWQPGAVENASQHTLLSWPSSYSCVKIIKKKKSLRSRIPV